MGQQEVYNVLQQHSGSDNWFTSRQILELVGNVNIGSVQTSIKKLAKQKEVDVLVVDAPGSKKKVRLYRLHKI